MSHFLGLAGRYTSQEIPRNAIPEESNEPRVAHLLIKDELQLDGRPLQNMATFLTEWMEPEAVKLMHQALPRNLADKDEYPYMHDMEERCVQMLWRLWHGPEGSKGVGAATTGSSEAFMMAALSHKFLWREKRKAQGKDSSRPNIVFGHNAQVVLEKFGRYFDVEFRMIPVTKEARYLADWSRIDEFVDENTICVVAILGSTFTGQMEDVRRLGERLDELQRRRGFDVPIHVDAASGGFVAPFAFEATAWDFRVPRVASINASGHKYGLVYPGVGWVVYRDQSWLHKDLVFSIDYLGGNSVTFTLNFSRPSYPIVGQYYNFLRLGMAGYRRVIGGCLENARWLSRQIAATGRFELLSDVHNEDVPALPLVALALKDRRAFDEYDLMYKLRETGWIVPAYKLPPSCEQTLCLRIVIRERHSRDIVQALFKDTVAALSFLDQRAAAMARKFSAKEAAQRALKAADAADAKAGAVTAGNEPRTYSNVC